MWVLIVIAGIMLLTVTGGIALWGMFDQVIRDEKRFDDQWTD